MELIQVHERERNPFSRLGGCWNDPTTGDVDRGGADARGAGALASYTYSEGVLTWCGLG